MKNLGLSSYNKGKSYERDLRAGYKRHFGPSSQFTLGCSISGRYKQHFDGGQTPPSDRSPFLDENQETELESLNTPHDHTLSKSNRNYICPEKNNMVNNSKKV